MRILSGGTGPCEIRHGAAVEVLVGESIVLETPMAYLDGAPVTGITVDGKTVAFTSCTPGRRRFRTVDGMFDLNVVACDPTVMDRLPNGDRVGHGRSDARMILRSLANNAEWFNGLASDLDNRPIGQFGGNAR